MRLWRQIQLYKNLLLGLWGLNVLLVVAGLTFLFLYFQSAYQAERAYQRHLTRIAALNEIESEIRALHETPSWTGKQWLKLGEIKARWDHELDSVSNPLGEVFSSQQPDLARGMAAVEAERLNSLSLLRESAGQTGRYRFEVIWIAAFSLMIGWIVPAILMWILKRKKDALQSRLEKQVAVTLRVWKAQSQKIQNEKGRPSGKFWVELTLLTLAQVSKEVEHPAAEYVHQVSQRIFNEMQSVEAGSSAENSVENGEQVS